MEPNYFYNFGYLTHSAFPEITFGILCLVAAVILTCLFVSAVKNRRYSVWTETKCRISETAVEKPSETIEDRPYPLFDLRKKIEGYWRIASGKLQFHIYSWGGAYLMEIKAVGSDEQPRYYAFSGTLSDDNKFYAENKGTYTFLYNEETDQLFFSDYEVFLERVSESAIDMENSIRKAVDEAISITTKDVTFDENK